MAAKQKGTVEETYRLPSLGKLYGEDFPEEVSIRSMTTFEEKMRLGNQGFWRTMCNMIDAVVTYPDNFDTKEMALFDFYFLMYKMRTVSYGPIYKVSVTCPHCGNQIVSRVNLDELDVDYLGEEITEPFEIGPLPRSGDTVQCRFLRVADSIENEKRSKEILRLHPDYVGEPNYILTLASEIFSVNGKTKTPIEAQMYVEKMQAMDSAYLRQAYDAKIGKVGMTTRCYDTCSSCGEDIEFELPINSEFFRPTFDF